MASCNNCGGEVADTAKFCSNCAAPVVSNEVHIVKDHGLFVEYSDGSFDFDDELDEVTQERAIMAMHNEIASRRGEPLRVVAFNDHWLLYLVEIAIKGKHQIDADTKARTLSAFLSNPQLRTLYPNAEAIFNVTELPTRKRPYIRLDLTPDQQKHLLVEPEDWLSIIPAELQRTMYKSEPCYASVSDGKGQFSRRNVGNIIEEEFLVRQLGGDMWQSTQKFTSNPENPLGLDRIGKDAVCVIYNSPGVNIGLLIGAVSYPSGQVWIKNDFSPFAQLRYWKARMQRFGKLAKFKNVPATPEQRQLVGVLLTDVAKTVGSWAEYFSPPTAPQASGRLS